MFEFNIWDGMPVREKVFVTGRSGKNVLKAVGKEVWKVKFQCTECHSDIESCFCFSTRERMEGAKKKISENGIFCSTQCYLENLKANNRPKFDKTIECMKEHKDCYENDYIDWDEMSTVADYYEIIYGEDDCGFDEYLDADSECPL